MIDSNALIEMMESSFDGVWITDGEGKVLFANSANASLLGVSKAELEGRTTQQLLDEKIFSNSVILEVIRQKKQISKISYNYHTRLTVLATATPISMMSEMSNMYLTMSGISQPSMNSRTV